MAAGGVLLLAATASLLVLFAAASTGAVKPRAGAYSGTTDGGFGISFHVNADRDEVVGLRTDFEPTLCPGIPPSSDPEQVKFPAAKIRGAGFSASIGNENVRGTFKGRDEVIGTVSTHFKVSGNPEPCSAEAEFTATLRGAGT